MISQGSSIAREPSKMQTATLTITCCWPATAPTRSAVECTSKHRPRTLVPAWARRPAPPGARFHGRDTQSVHQDKTSHNIRHDQGKMLLASIYAWWLCFLPMYSCHPSNAQNAAGDNFIEAQNQQSGVIQRQMAKYLGESGPTRDIWKWGRGL